MSFKSGYQVLLTILSGKAITFHAANLPNKVEYDTSRSLKLIDQVKILKLYIKANVNRFHQFVGKLSILLCVNFSKMDRVS